MRSILISIRPQWVAKILNGEKTIEVRKTAPRCELPCEVYIYCTNGREVIKPSKTNPRYEKIRSCSPKKGCVCAKFTLNKVDEIENDRLWGIREDFLEQACLSFGELACYLSSKKGYAWHIDDLVIFDKPKELGDFNKPDVPTYEQSKSLIEMTTGRPYTEKDYRDDCKRLSYCVTKAPQSWCYAEAEE